MSAPLSPANMAALHELAEDLESIVQFVSTRDGDATARQHQRAEAVRAALVALADAAPAPVPPPPVEDMPEIRSGDRIEFTDTAEVETEYRSGNFKCWEGSVVEPRHIMLVERNGVVIWQRRKET